MTKQIRRPGAAGLGVLPQAEVWHRPVFWLFVVGVIGLVDATLPTESHVYGLAFLAVPLAWAMLHRRSIALFMAALAVTIALNGASRVIAAWMGGADASAYLGTPLTSDSMNDSGAPTWPWAVFGVGRIWVLLGLLAQWWLHKQLQKRRRRRLRFRRELLDRVRQRTGQVKRANTALRQEVARRQETQHLLNQSETTFQALIDRMELQVARKDTEGVITFANEIYCDKLGKTHAEVIGSTDDDHFSDEIAADYREDDRRVMQTGQIVDQIEKHPTADGSVGFAQVFKAPEYDKDGNCIGIQIIFWDVTRKHLGDISLRDSEARKRALLNSVGDSVLLLDADGGVVEANPAAVSLFGPELVGKCFDDFAKDIAVDGEPDDARPTASAILQMPRGTRKERTIERSDSSQFVSEISVHDIPVGNEQGSAVVIRDVTPQRRAIEALRSAKAAAEIANRTKTEFMASVSHELRTPLGGIMGLAELLEKMELSSQAHQYIGMIRDSANSLSDVIEDILDFAAIEAGRVEIDPSPIDLYRVIGDAYKSLAVRASNQPVRLIYSVGPNVPRFVIGDAKRLRQIIVNLVGNAIKFTPHGEVRVRLDVEVNEESSDASHLVRVCIKVADTGVGIPYDKQQKVFGAFERGEVGTRRSFGGTGLGLSICDGLVRRMNGRIELSSQPGFGSQFTCVVPFQVLDETSWRELEFDHPLTLRSKQSTTFKAVVHTGCNNMNEAIAESLQRIGVSVISLDDASQRDGSQMLIWFVREDAANGNRDTERTAVDWQSLSVPQRDRVVWIQVVGQPCPPRSSSRDLHANEPMTPDEVAHLIDRIETDHLTYGSANPTPSGMSMLGTVKPSAVGKDSGDGTRVAIDQSHLLLVDDSEVNRVVITQQLLKMGHHVETAEDGEMALRMAVEHHYDAVLMDLQMPKMDGAEATVHIREAYRRDGKMPPPVIALTAHVTQEHQELCRNAGMVGFVTKPIRSDDLAAAIERVLSRNVLDSHETNEDATAFEVTKPSTESSPNAENEPDEQLIRARLMGHSNNDRTIALSLCDAFAQEIPDLLSRLRRGVAAKRFPEFGRAAHTLKSCLRYVANSDDVSQATAIEAMAKEEALPTDEQIAVIEEMATRWVQAVKQTKTSWPKEK